MTRFLFQGDSITDGNRGRGDDPNHTIGHSYPYPISTYLGYHHPEWDIEFMNRGVSGDDVTNLYARWQTETLNLRPDILSILIGVNDAMHRFDAHENYVDVFESTYRLLLDRCLKMNPDMKFIILEPFTLDIHNLGDYETRRSFVYEHAASAKKVAADYGAVFVPLQQRFTDACKRKPANYWIWDSVHPTYNGHGLIADAFLNDTADFFASYKF